MAFEAEVQTLGEVRILSISGDVDDRSTRDFQALLMKSAGEDERSMLLDFDDLEWMNSLCLRALVTLNRRLKAEHRRLAVCGLGSRMEKALEVAGLKHLLPIFTTRNDAGDWLSHSARIDRICELANKIMAPDEEETGGAARRFDFATQRVAAVAAEILQEMQAQGNSPAPAKPKDGSTDPDGEH